MQNNMKRSVVLFLVTIPFLFSCASVSRKNSLKSYPPEGIEVPKGYSQTGVASWYGVEEHGRQAASGQRFSMYAYTAAHRSLPIETVVRVTNLENGRDIVVRINDRGPFIEGRIIDLSYAAAKALDMIGDGTAKVKVEVISAPGRKSNYFQAKYTVQIGSFRDRENALSLKEELNSMLDNVQVDAIELDGDIFHRVRIGRFSKKHDAEKLAVELRGRGYYGRVIQE
jgi:rare lipoprotein A